MTRIQRTAKGGGGTAEGVNLTEHTEAEFTVEQDGWEPAAGFSIYRISGNANGLAINGIIPPKAGERNEITLVNVGSKELVITNNSGKPASPKRKILLSTASEVGGQLVVADTVTLFYDATSERWRDIGAFGYVPVKGESGNLLVRGAREKYPEATWKKPKAPLLATGTEVELEKEMPFSFDSPIEVPAGKTYEVPSNVQGLWKESISVQGTLNVQGRFDEVGTPERIADTELTESYVKQNGRIPTQSIAGGETKAAAEALSMKIRPYTGASAFIDFGLTVLKVIGFTAGAEIEGGLKLIGTGALEAVAGSTVLGGLSKEAGVSLTQLAFKSIETPAEITSNRKDYAVTVSAPRVWYRIKASGAFSIFGLEHTGLAEGKIFMFTNIGANTITFTGESTESATVTDRFIIGAAGNGSQALEQNKTIWVGYDSKSERWRIIGGPSG